MDIDIVDAFTIAVAWIAVDIFLQHYVNFYLIVADPPVTLPAQIHFMSIPLRFFIIIK